MRRRGVIREILDREPMEKERKVRGSDRDDPHLEAIGSGAAPAYFPREVEQIGDLARGDTLVPALDLLKHEESAVLRSMFMATLMRSRWI
jgi:hypothetical protein